jgi:enoyl-CoA hydratase/carnithine racemase
MSDRVIVSITDGIADVRLNRPEKRNALDNAMFQAIAEAGERMTTEPGVRVVVLSGEGASFCAGLDFSSMQTITSGTSGTSDARDSSTASSPASSEPSSSEPSSSDSSAGGPGSMEEGRITHLGQQVAWVWQEVPVPVIAAVHGHALGGGIQIALGADIRIVHPDTKLSVREIH